MTVTAITATYERPAAMAICERYMARQTRKPDQWLILDGPDRMQKKVLDAIASDRIDGDVVVFFEDDDWFRSDWIEWCANKVDEGYEIVGEGNATYYNVAHRWTSECFNARHASLCSTAIHRDLLENVANVIKSYDWPFFDTRLWELDANKHLALPMRDADKRVVGIKGIRDAAGRLGYSGEHHFLLPEGSRADPSLFALWRLIGADAGNYVSFNKHHERQAA